MSHCDPTVNLFDVLHCVRGDWLVDLWRIDARGADRGCAVMRIFVIGAGAVGNATAFYLRQQGHEVTVVERQPGAARETSFGNGGVIHASEVEPWSQPGMPLKILSWLGQENAPLLLRYGAIPQMWRWGLEFARIVDGEVPAQCQGQSAPRSPQPSLAAGDRRRDGGQLRPGDARGPEDLSRSEEP